MDLRKDLTGSAQEQCDERRSRIEKELGIRLSVAQVNPDTMGNANEKNCENMWGQVAIPLGLAGPLNVTLSSKEKQSVYLPLATTEGALVASINRGCKAASVRGIKLSSLYHGMSRSIALKTADPKKLIKVIEAKQSEWKKIGEATSGHLKLLSYDIDTAEDYVFLTLWCDTDLAMGMNMTTIAAEAIGEWIAKSLNAELITVAANVDSDKKPSIYVKEDGRGFEVTATASVDEETLQTTLKTTADQFMETFHAKIELGSQLAGALGSNAHAANIIAALYLATGQDTAHVVEGSLADTSVKKQKDGIEISVRCPAILVGTLGGGTALPVQKKCLEILLRETSSLKKSQQLAEIIGGAVLAGELSLLAALASQSLSKAHKEFGR